MVGKMVEREKSMKSDILKLQCNEGERNQIQEEHFAAEADSTTSAIFILACIFCSPSN